MKRYAIAAFIILTWAGCKKKNSEDIAPSSSAVTLTATTTTKDKQGNTYTVGFDQVTSLNQDAFVEKKNANGQTIWKLNYENTAPDSRGVWITLDENDTPWAVFSIDGGSNDAGYITRKEVETNAFSGVFLSGYGKGGGAKVAIIAQLNPTTGKIVKGTFIVSRTNEGNHNAVDKTNSFEITRFGVNKGIVAFEGHSWFKPFSEQATESNYKFHPEATDVNKFGSYWKLLINLPTSLNKIQYSGIIKP